MVINDKYNPESLYRFVKLLLKKAFKFISCYSIIHIHIVITYNLTIYLPPALMLPACFTHIYISKT